MAPKFSTLLFILLGLLHTGTVTSATSANPQTYTHTTKQAEAAAKDSADFVGISQLDPLEEIFESVKIFLLGMGVWSSI